MALGYVPRIVTYPRKKVPGYTGKIGEPSNPELFSFWVTLRPSTVIVWLWTIVTVLKFYAFYYPRANNQYKRSRRNPKKFGSSRNAATDESTEHKEVCYVK